MSIQIVHHDHYEKLKYILDSIDSEIKIVSPFIKDETANLLCTILHSNPDIKCTIITRFVRQEFAEHASSLHALQKLLDNGADIYALRYLHSKLYLIDDSIAMMGSANFTSGGFRFNHELSLLLEDEPELVPELHQYFDDILCEIKSQNNSQVTKQLIEDEQSIIEKHIKNRKDKTAHHNISDDIQYGAIIAKIAKESTKPSSDDIQDILCRTEKKPSCKRIWLKFEGTSEERLDPDAPYFHFTPDGYPEGITCFPGSKKPTGIEAGDLIYIAAVTQDALGNNTPVIVGRCSTYGYEAENIATPEMIAKTPWLERYSAFIRLKDVEYLTTEQKNGISLLHLLTVIGKDMYPSTTGTTKSVPELRAMHYRRSHIRITEKAAEYINSQFDKLAKKYGTNLSSSTASDERKCPD